MFLSGIRLCLPPTTKLSTVIFSASRRPSLPTFEAGTSYDASRLGQRRRVERRVKVRGYTLFGRALARQGVDTLFFIMGGPINDAVKAAMAEGIRAIDVRHEQAAAMMANAYARVRSRAGVCMAASGPGTINLTT